MSEEQQISILLVDDEEGIRVLFKFLLEDIGHNVTAVGNGEDAFNLLKDEVNSFDLLISDLQMPKLGGEALFKKIHEEIPESRRPKIICVTGGKLEGSKEMESDLKNIVDIHL